MVLRNVVLVVTALVAGAAAGGAVVHLRSGGSITGEILRADAGEVSIRTTAGIVTTIRQADIARIDATPLPDEPSRPARPGPRPRASSRPAVAPALIPAEHSPTCPRDCPRCRRLFDLSLARYCGAVDRQPAQAPTPVQLRAWPALQVPTCSVTGLVLLGEGTTLTAGTHRATLRRLADYVRRYGPMTHRAMESHQSWVLAFGALFLSELHRVQPTPQLKATIQRMVTLLESGRQGEAGWCHTLKRHPKSYGPFVATTVWAAAALAAAKQQGVNVDEAGLRATFAGLRKSVGRSGGAFYYVTGRTDVSPGRAGGVAWVLTRLDGGGTEADRAKAFLLRHVEDVPNGHASGMMNFGWGALGAAVLGADVHEAFWKVHRKTVLEARAATGIFGPQPWKDLGFTDGNDRKEPVEGKNTTWPDPMYGPGWATPWMLLAWQTGMGKCVLAGRPAATQPAD